MDGPGDRLWPAARIARGNSRAVLASALDTFSKVSEESDADRIATSASYPETLKDASDPCFDAFRIPFEKTREQFR